MASTTITDKRVHSFKAETIGGRQYPPFPIDSLNNAFNFKARPDDIVLCAYQRSGTHWTYEIVRFLLAGTTELPHSPKENGFIEFKPPSSLEELPSPRNLNTHYQFDSLSPEFLRHKCKIIHVTRNPRDQCVSEYNMKRKFPDFKGQWNDHFEQVMEGKVWYGTWFEYTKGWEQGMKENPDHPFLVISFESMKQDPLREIKRISEFLGLKHTEDFLMEVMKKTGFDVMAGRMAEVLKMAATEKETRIAQNACVKGVVGDWKNWFTVAQSEIYEDVFEREMPGTDAYKFYSLKQ